MCVESLHRIFIRRDAPEADETVRADQNHTSLGQSRLLREGVRICPLND